MKSGIELIKKERARQISKGYTKEHDEDETAMQLSYAAASFIVNAQNLFFKDHTHYDGMGNITRLQSRDLDTKKFKEVWPWADHDGRKKADIKTSLIKAGALIAAEIDRLNSE